MADTIASVDIFVVRLPIEAPLRHSYGVHTAFTRTLVRLTTQEGIEGWGETSARASQLRAVEGLVRGMDPFKLEELRMRIGQRGYYSRETLVLTAYEMALYDIQGKIAGRPVSDLLGGALRDRVELAAYVFYRYPTDERPGVTRPEEVADHAADLVARYGFRTVKLKGGVLPPEHDRDAIAALRERLGDGVLLRLDPNAVWTPETALRIAASLERRGIELEYLEDPTWGIEGMATVRGRTAYPLATNMCVTHFDQLGPAVRAGAVDVILSDPWYWGGLFPTRILGQTASAFGLGVGMHSGIETGIGLSAMLHVASTMPQLVRAIDSHYHHLVDDILQGGKLAYREGAMAVPRGPGLGVEVDMEKVRRYQIDPEQAATERASSPPDPRRPEWFARYPGW